MRSSFSFEWNWLYSAELPNFNIPHIHFKLVYHILWLKSQLCHLRPLPVVCTVVFTWSIVGALKLLIVGPRDVPTIKRHYVYYALSVSECGHGGHCSPTMQLKSYFIGSYISTWIYYLLVHSSEHVCIIAHHTIYLNTQNTLHSLDVFYAFCDTAWGVGPTSDSTKLTLSDHVIPEDICSTLVAPLWHGKGVAQTEGCFCFGR